MAKHVVSIADAPSGTFTKVKTILGDPAGWVYEKPEFSFSGDNELLVDVLALEGVTLVSSEVDSEPEALSALRAIDEARLAAAAEAEAKAKAAAEAEAKAKAAAEAEAKAKAKAAAEAEAKEKALLGATFIVTVNSRITERGTLGIDPKGRKVPVQSLKDIHARSAGPRFANQTKVEVYRGKMLIDTFPK